MPDASPTKWHLAHTTWFFETFVLGRRSEHAHLFNSYYEALGPRVARASRGLISRPSLAEVRAYRARIDDEVLRRGGGDPALLELGLHHEQQHQELLLTDIQHALAQNPLRPVYREGNELVPAATAAPLRWQRHDGGLVHLGHDGTAFSFDNERPRHRVFVEPFELANRLVTNAEWVEFMKDGGYTRPELWLSDGWATVQAERWSAPLYWEQRDGAWWHFTLHGLRPVEPAAPVAHVSHYEADAFARWAGARLPTEAEWELAPLFGACWQWTSSAYLPYPGFAPQAGAVGEYNGKFMSGQLVLRGGSCFTPPGHVRPSYRNFFPPAARWQVTGLRLARNTTP